jgi:hypothetical protein
MGRWEVDLCILLQAGKQHLQRTGGSQRSVLSAASWWMPCSRGSPSRCLLLYERNLTCTRQPAHINLAAAYCHALIRCAIQSSARSEADQLNMSRLRQAGYVSAFWTFVSRIMNILAPLLVVIQT